MTQRFKRTARFDFAKGRVVRVEQYELGNPPRPYLYEYLGYNCRLCARFEHHQRRSDVLYLLASLRSGAWSGSIVLCESCQREHGLGW